MASTTFAAIVTTARRLARQTAAEFDYSLTRDDFSEFGPYGWLELAASSHDVRLSVYKDEVDAMVRRAKAQKYTGWSDAARARGQKIQYAD